MDWFRLAAAFMIVAIHTAPFAAYGEKADVLITYCLFRVAVPFFLMVTGYFVLYGWTQGKPAKLKKYLSKTAGIYVFATLLYLPVNLYAGKRLNGAGEFFKALLFDGTFYHLWYLPAALAGCLVVMGLYLVWGLKGSGVIALILYVIGTLGDSYFGFVSQWEMSRNFYDSIFLFSSYTRNGIFYAPLFLWLGLAVRQQEKGYGQDKQTGATEHKRRLLWRTAGLLAAVSFLLAEGWWTYENEWQKHNSMYFALPVVMYFLFRLLTGMKGAEIPGMRSVSMWIYLLHPLCILLVRGAAKVLKLTKVLVEQSLIHFLAVCAVSLVAALAADRCVNLYRLRRRRDNV